MEGEIFKNILTNNFNEIEYKDHEIEKRVNVLDVLDKLNGWRYDNDIADELDVKVVTVRRLLNELHEYDLVKYKRAKNKETGWYTYLWKKRDDKSSEYVKKCLNLHLLKLRSALEYEENNIWFNCSCSRTTLDGAMENNFKCPFCGENYVESGASDEIEKIESDIRAIKAIMKGL